jgi:prefoldin subunit 5
MNDNPSQGRLLAQTCSCRPYKDNYDEIMKICEETGRKPAEVLRDALDEWLLMRRAAATTTALSPDDRQSDLEAKIEELRQDIRRLAERHEELARSIDYVQRRDHGYLLEIFLAAYGARDLMWRDIANRMRQGKQTPESIQAQYEALEREWNAQCNATADRIKDVIQKGRNHAQT